VILGPIPPVLRLALTNAWKDSVRVRETGSSGAELLALSRRLGATAAVSTRNDVIDLCEEQTGGDVLLVGVSTASWDVLWCRGSGLHHTVNPSADALRRLIVGSVKHGNSEL
jgi:hypothetical protein